MMIPSVMRKTEYKPNRFRYIYFSTQKVEYYVEKEEIKKKVTSKRIRPVMHLTPLSKLLTVSLRFCLYCRPGSLLELWTLFQALVLQREQLSPATSTSIKWLSLVLQRCLSVMSLCVHVMCDSIRKSGSQGFSDMHRPHKTLFLLAYCRLNMMHVPKVKSLHHKWARILECNHWSAFSALAEFHYHG